MLKTARQLPSEPEIGQRLRALRQEKGLTLQEVARRSGISMSTISKIENDRVSPTFASLLKLAEAFEMPLTTLIGGLSPTTPPSTARIAITRREEITFARTQSYEMGALCAGLRNKRMSPFLDRVHVSATSVGDRLVRHDGEEFVYVLKGVLEIHTEHYAPIVLKAGDSAYLDSQMAHAYRSGDGSPAEMLMVWLPPDGSSGDLVSTIAAADIPPLAESPTGKSPRNKRAKKPART